MSASEDSVILRLCLGESWLLLMVVCNVLRLKTQRSAFGFDWWGDDTIYNCGNQIDDLSINHVVDSTLPDLEAMNGGF